MTKCYFYTDLLAAAWMAKHFGMFLTLPTLKSFDYANQKGFKWESIAHGPYSEKYYVHPDSLHALEPQVGDWGTDGEYSGEVGGVDASLTTICVPERHNGKHY